MANLTAGVPGHAAVARVLLESSLPQLDHLFDYRIPDRLSGRMAFGQRVRVPFRSKERHSLGWVIEIAENSDFAGELADIAEIVGDIPLLTPDVWHLARAVADRAGGSACDVLRLAIPKRLVRVERAHLQRDDGSLVNEHAIDPPSDSTGPVAGVHGSAMAQALQTGARRSLLVSHGVEQVSTGAWVGRWATTIAEIAHLLLQSGKSTIIAVPDYREIDQVRDALGALGIGGGENDDLVRVDSRQSNGERFAGFLRALDERPRVILGNRSAVYAPAHELGAIILWNDGDPLFTEPLAPYVHARDAALVRAKQRGAGLLFTDYSRSIDVERLVKLGYVAQQEHAPRRTVIRHADAAVAPEAYAGRVPDFAARTIRQALPHGPVLVQVASPGYAPVARCQSCGAPGHCAVCAGPLHFRSAGTASCRWCGERANGWQCAECGSRKLIERGHGATRTVEQFKQQFEGARVLLSDGANPRSSVDARSAIVVATRGAEPIAAGGYAAVVLLDIERALLQARLSAAEDAVRSWEHAAALAADDALCLVATGGGPAVDAFLHDRVSLWLREELHQRGTLRFPPAVRVASVTGSPERVSRATGAVASLSGVDSLGPTPIDPTPGSLEEGLVRAIVRFPYAEGDVVAARLRGALVHDAVGTGARSPRHRAAGAGRLRLRFDDRGAFDG